MKFTKNHRVLFIIHDLHQEDNQFLLGPAYLAAVLDKEGAYVESYCMDVFHYTNEQLAEFLDKNKFDLICLSFLAARFKRTVEPLCKVINKHKGNAWLVLGGHCSSAIPEYILRKTKADVVAIGEAENVIIGLLETKINNSNIFEVRGIAFLAGNKVIFTGKNIIVEDLDMIPFPLWKIFPMDKYTTCFKLYKQKPGERSFSIITSRGCVNRCNFCMRLEKGIRLRSIKNIVEELKLLKKYYGVNNYIFQDELFVLNKQRIKDFINSLKRANLKIKFFCNARVDTIDIEMVKLLKQAGAVFINLGLESTSDKVLKLMNKHTTVKQNLRAIQAIRNVRDVGIGLNFLWNNFGDTIDTLKENARWIKKYNTYYQCRTIRPTTPYPGCDLYYECIKRGLLKGPADFFNKFKNSDLMLVNLMKMSTARAYKELFKVNRDLILDNYLNIKGDLNYANMLIQDLQDLYLGKTIIFRGVRHYENK